MTHSNYPTRREKYLEKPLPSSDESEKAILGSILLDNSLMDSVMATLTPEDFYSPLHRRVFDAMLALSRRGSRIDPILIGEELKKTSSLDSLGGTATITNLAFGLPHFADLSEYVKTVKDYSIVRSAVRLCGQTVDTLLEGREDPHTALNEHEAALTSVRETGHEKGFTDAGSLAVSVVNKAIQQANQGADVSIGLPCGIKDVDNMTNGFQKTDLIVIAGRPSHGKTSFANTAVLNMTAYNPEWVVAYFSLEMSESQMMNRLLCSEAHVDGHRFQRASLLSKEWEQLKSAAERIAKRKIFIYDEPGTSPHKIKALSRQLKKKQKRLDFIVIDHLGYMVANKPTGNLYQDSGQITKDLKALAKEFDVPVALLCQLSRKNEDRADKRPTPADLRDSGKIEEDADVVMLMHRPEKFKPSDKPGVAEVIVGKQRNGPTGIVDTTFIKNCMRFEDLAH